jgi:hypothetical protein
MRESIFWAYIGEYALPCPAEHDAKERCGTSATQSKEVMPSTILQRTSNGEESIFYNPLFATICPETFSNLCVESVRDM